MQNIMTDDAILLPASATVYMQASLSALSDHFASTSNLYPALNARKVKVKQPYCVRLFIWPFVIPRCLRIGDNS